jgi:hypothetical protein
MTMLGWFLMAVFALVASVSWLLAFLAEWAASRLRKENDRLREKNFRLEREKREEIEYAHRAFRDFSPEDPATVLLFPESEAGEARGA